MKKLNKESFIIILTGLILSFCLRVYNTFRSRQHSFARLLERRDLTDEALEMLRRFLFGLNLIYTFVVFFVLLFFVVKIFDNKDKESKQGYVSFLFYISIVFLVINILLLLRFDHTTVFSIIINITIITGCSIQRKISQ